jgi:hypothetical protein
MPTPTAPLLLLLLRFIAGTFPDAGADVAACRT